MDGSQRVRLGLLLWPLRRLIPAHRPHRALLVVAVLSLAPWLPAPARPVAAAFVARSLYLPAGTSLVGLAVDPGLGRVFVADTGAQVWALDERTGQILGASSVATSGATAVSRAMVVDEGHHLVYVTTLAGYLEMLDGRTGVPGIPLTMQPTSGLALDSVADRLLISQPRDRALLALDVETEQVVASIALADPAGLVAVDATARRVYVVAAGAARLDIIDADTYRPLATPTLSGPADELAVDTTTHRVYAANAATGAVTVVEGRSGAVMATLRVGSSAAALAVNPATGHLFIADADAGNVAVVDTRRNAIVADVPVVGTPSAMAVDPRTGLVYVASGAAGAAAALPSGHTVTVLRDQRPSPSLPAALRIQS